MIRKPYEPREPHKIALEIVILVCIIILLIEWIRHY